MVSGGRHNENIQTNFKISRILNGMVQMWVCQQIANKIKIHKYKY